MRECFKLGIMGCLPSRRRDDASESTSNDINSPVGKAGSKRHSNSADAVQKNDKSALAPTIQMVNEDTLKLLKEIGELKVFQTASNADHKKNIDLHQDIILALENPSKARSPGTSLPNATVWNGLVWKASEISPGSEDKNIDILELNTEVRWSPPCDALSRLVDKLRAIGSANTWCSFVNRSFLASVDLQRFRVLGFCGFIIDGAFWLGNLLSRKKATHGIGPIFLTRET